MLKQHINLKKGSALIFVFVVMIVLLAMTGSFVIFTGTQTKYISQDIDSERCYGILLAGIADGVAELNLRQNVDTNPGPVGSGEPDDGVTDWVDFGRGQYRVMRAFQEQGRFKLLVQARLGTVERFAEVIAQVDTETTELPGAPFVHALFQGGQNPTGNFEWAGTGSNADKIGVFPPDPSTRNGSYPNFEAIEAAGNEQGGNIYVGDDIDISGDAEVPSSSTVKADGSINNTSSGASGVTEEENETLSTPEGADYSVDPDVIFVNPSEFNATVSFDGGAKLFGDSGDASGNGADYAHKDDPRHVFRMDSGDTNVKNDTDRNDFFFEDMFADGDGHGYEGGSGADQEPHYDADTGYQTTIAPSGNNKTYFVDGNVWIHNAGPLTFRLMTTGTEGTKITVVAKGNVFISDNFTYENLEKDAIALIAIKEDVDYPDEFGVPSGNETTEGSGNIQFGDLNFGTTFRFAGFMYAENDFLAENVDNELHVYGNMTAGNEVKIAKGSGSGRKALNIDYDARIENGDISLPGLPSDPSGTGVITDTYHPGTYRIRGYIEVGAARALAEIANDEWEIDGTP